MPITSEDPRGGDSGYESPPVLKPRILMVEDSEDDALLILRELRRGRIDPEYLRVQTEPKFVAALTGNSWDIVLSDFSMPTFNGMSAFDIVQDLRLEVPFLFVSGRIGEDRAAEAMRRGVRDYILKDNLKRLAPAVRREIQEAEELRRRKATLLALERSEENFKHLIEATIQGVAVVRELRVQFTNQAFARLFGYGAPEEILALPSIADLIAPVDRERVLNTKLGARAIDQGPLRVEIQGLQRNGAVVHLDVSIVSVWWEGHRAYLVSAVDITERKLAETALRDSEQRFLAFMNAGPAVSWIIDEAGRQIFASETAQAAFGWKREGSRGLAANEQGALPGVESFHESDREVLELAKPVEGLIETRRTSGEIVSWQTVKFPFSDSVGRRYVGGIALDVSGKKRAEDQVQASQRLLQTVFDTIPHAVTVKDARARYLKVNRSWLQRYGLRDDEPIGKTATELSGLDPDYARHYVAQDHRALAGEDFTVLEGTERIVEGQIRDFHTIKTPIRDDQGVVTGLVGITVDLTDLKEARHKEDMATARLSDAIESLPAGFFLYDSKDQLVLWNSRVRELFPELAGVLRRGLSFEELLRRVAPCLVIPVEDREDWIQERLHQFRVHPVTFLHQRTDGRWMQGYDRRTSDGGTVSLRFDVTELKARESELQQAQKMEAVGLLTGGVAHDFNNLLQVISGFTELALIDLPPGSGASNNMQAVSEACRKAAALTEQLLAFSHKQVLRPQPVDLNDIVQGIAKLIGRLVPSSVSLVLKTDQDVHPVMADRVSVEQVLMNLAVNARDAMKDGGQIEIETGTAVLDDAFCLGNPWARRGRYATLRFSDTGTGMTPEVQRRLFEPFFTTKEAGKGTGLGLSMIYGIVKQHEGLIRIESAPGAGTTFWVYLPVLGQDRMEVDAVAEALAPGGSETVLVAQEDPKLRELLAAALRTSGYTVLLAADGDEALKTFAKAPQIIHLAVLDMTLRKLNGIECFEKLREVRAGVRALFCSGWFSEAEQRTLARLNQPFLYRPYSSEQLLRAVRSALDRPTAG